MVMQPVTNPEGKKGFYDDSTGFVSIDDMQKVTNDKGQKGYYHPKSGFVAAPDAPAPVSEPASTWRNTVSAIARPSLQALGMVGGGVAGLPLAPESLGMSSVAGAGLGYAGGEQVANKLDELMGIRKPQPLGHELIGAGKDIASGAAMEMGGPVVGEAISGVSGLVKSGAARLINSLIKPHMRDFSYGKNPGLGVANEGIVATSLDDLAKKVDAVRTKVGQAISSVVSKPEHATKALDLSDITKPIDEAIANAAKSPRTNNALIERLLNTKKDILQVQEQLSPTGEMTYAYGRNLTALSPEEALALKREIGDITKFTGNMSDDALVNKALKRTYGTIDSKLDSAIPEIKGLNERYANLTGASVATKHRDLISSRQNIVHLMPGLTGLATGIATGRPFEGAGALILYESLNSTLGKTAAAQLMKKMGTAIPSKETASALIRASAIMGTQKEQKKYETIE